MYMRNCGSSYKVESLSKEEFSYSHRFDDVASRNVAEIFKTSGYQSGYDITHFGIRNWPLTF